MIGNTIRTLAVRQMQTRGVSSVAGPAMNRISSAEKAVHAGVMFCGFLFFPGWVLFHLREYKGKE